MRMSPRSRLTALLAVALASGGCHSSTGSDLAPSRAAGSYVLEAVSGRGPVTGNIALTADARAERRVRYATGGGTAEYVAVGTFQLTSGGIVFSLREDSGRSSYVWQVRGEWTGALITIRYPDPADGPEIVETYRRQ